MLFVGDVFAGPCRGVCKDGTFLPSSTESGTWSLCPVLEDNSESAVLEGVRYEGSNGPGFALKMDQQS